MAFNTRDCYYSISSGVYLIYVFLTSKRHVISINPDGGKPIVFETKGMKRDFLDDFIDKIEKTSMKLKKL